MLNLKRTISHFHEDKSESVLTLSTIQFDAEGSMGLVIGNDQGDSVVAHSKDQADTLAWHLMNIGAEIWDT